MTKFGMRILFFAAQNKPEPWIAALRAALPEADIAEWHPGSAPADHVVVWSPPQQLFDEQPQLKGVFNMGAGVDALLKLQLPAGAALVRLDDAGMSVQMAEFVCHAIIRHFRELDVYEREAAQGRWGFRKPQLRADFPVGIMGLGVLGERVAQAIRQFEFPLVGWSRSPKQIEGMRTFAGEAGFNDFLAASRFLVCLLPLTAETRGILNRESMSKLRPGGYVINVARGGHLVEEDLIPLLDSGHLAGATLDVFREEPLAAGHPFWTHPKITVTPHTSARTLREETVAQIAEKIRAFEGGKPIAGVVDRLRGY